MCMLLDAMQHGDLPDVVVFMDVGDPDHIDPAEWPETYTYLEEVVKPLLDDLGVKFVWMSTLMYPIRDARSLYEWFKARGQVPLSGPDHLCSVVAKVERFEKWMNDYFPAGTKIDVWIGFAKGEEARAERDPHGKKGETKKKKLKKGEEEPVHRSNRFPLMERELTRDDCKALIAKAGYKVPRKSACVFCPYGEQSEWQEFARRFPAEFMKIMALEREKDLTAKGYKIYIHQFSKFGLSPGQYKIMRDIELGNTERFLTRTTRGTMAELARRAGVQPVPETEGGWAAATKERIIAATKKQLGDVKVTIKGDKKKGRTMTVEPVGTVKKSLGTLGDRSWVSLAKEEPELSSYGYAIMEEAGPAWKGPPLNEEGNPQKDDPDLVERVAIGGCTNWKQLESREEGLSATAYNALHAVAEGRELGLKGPDKAAYTKLKKQREFLTADGELTRAGRDALAAAGPGYRGPPHKQVCVEYERKPIFGIHYTGTPVEDYSGYNDGATCEVTTEEDALNRGLAGDIVPAARLTRLVRKPGEQLALLNRRRRNARPLTGIRQAREFMSALDYIEQANDIWEVVERLQETVPQYDSPTVQGTLLQAGILRAEKFGFRCRSRFPIEECAAELEEWAGTRQVDLFKPPKKRNPYQGVDKVHAVEQLWGVGAIDLSNQELDELRRNPKKQSSLFSAEEEGFALVGQRGDPVGRVKPPKGTQQPLIETKVSAERLAELREQELEERRAKKKKRKKKNPEPQRRSEKIEELDRRLRRLVDHLKSVDDILDRGKPSAGEERTLREDAARFRQQIRGVKEAIDLLERQIKLEGDLLHPPPPSTWGVITNPAPIYSEPAGGLIVIHVFEDDRGGYTAAIYEEGRPSGISYYGDTIEDSLQRARPTAKLRVHPRPSPFVSPGERFRRTPREELETQLSRTALKKALMR